MRKNLILTACALVTLFAGSALRAETAPAAAEKVATPDSASTAAPEQEGLPDQIASQLTPEPLDMYGVRNGPCSVWVPCPSYTISCSGNSGCAWKTHTSWSLPGWVECDGVRTTCVLSPD